MTVLERLKMELSNYPYFTDDEYTQFLTENNLVADDEYSKSDMYRSLLYTVLDILEAVSNDIDTMRSFSTEFNDVGQSYEYIESRIRQVKDKIASIPEEGEETSCFTLMYTRTPKWSPRRRGANAITQSQIDSLLSD